jgi:Uncharacterized protein conserved in bacteria C-term(DUF2220)
MSTSADLADCLRAAACGRTRVSLDDIWRVFLKLRPELGTSPEKRGELARWIGEAAATGSFSLPKGVKRFDRSANPPLPLWVALPQDVISDDRFDHRTYPWSTPMIFVAGLARLPSPADAVALNRFFLEHKTLESVPAKERSYEIFGDEKRLSAILDGLLGQGISLETLNCYDPVLVPVHRVFQMDAGAPDRVLIVENEASFDSFCRWNRMYLFWRVVVWGRGIEVWKGVPFLGEIGTDATSYQYFGDLDQMGVSIAYRLSGELLRTGRRLVPLRGAYRQLARRAGRVDAQPAAADWPKAIHWLADPEIESTAELLFAADKRVAQEALGWETLMHLDPADLAGV